MSKFYTVVILTCVALLSGCTSIFGYPGYYSIYVYDANGNWLNADTSIVASGSTMPTTIVAICRTFPGSSLVLKNTQTRQKTDNSPYQCAGPRVEIITQEFKAPESVRFSGKVFRLAHRSVKKGLGLYEYTANNEDIKEWTELLTLTFARGFWSYVPELGVKAIKKQGGMVDRSYMADGNHYMSTIFKPSTKTPYFEASTHKGSYLDRCNGWIFQKFSKKYPVNDDDKIHSEQNKVMQTLESSDWAPTCVLPDG